MSSSSLKVAVMLLQAIIFAAIAYGILWIVKGRPAIPVLPFMAILAGAVVVSFGIQYLANRVGSTKGPNKQQGSRDKNGT